MHKHDVSITETVATVKRMEFVHTYQHDEEMRNGAVSCDSRVGAWERRFGDRQLQEVTQFLPPVCHCVDVRGPALAFGVSYHLNNQVNATIGENRSVQSCWAS